MQMELWFVFVLYKPLPLLIKWYTQQVKEKIDSFQLLSVFSFALLFVSPHVDIYI